MSSWHFVNADGVYITVFPCEEDTLIYVYYEDKEVTGEGYEGENEEGTKLEG